MPKEKLNNNEFLQQFVPCLPTNINMLKFYPFVHVGLIFFKLTRFLNLIKVVFRTEADHNNSSSPLLFGGSRGTLWKWLTMTADIFWFHLSTNYALSHTVDCRTYVVNELVNLKSSMLVHYSFLCVHSSNGSYKWKQVLVYEECMYLGDAGYVHDP